MRARFLLSWILAWIQLRDAASFSVQVWCDGHQSQTRLTVAESGVSANVTVDQLFSDHEDKIHDYCRRHCCSLGTCNVGTAKKSGNTTACLVYGLYVKDLCTFKKATDDLDCFRNVTAAPPTTTTQNSSLPSEGRSTTPSAFTDSVNTTSTPAVPHPNSTSVHDNTTTTISRTDDEPTTTSEYTTASSAPTHDEPLHRLLKLLESSVKPRKGVHFDANDITEPTSTTKGTTYKNTDRAEDPTPVHTPTSATEEETGYTKHNLNEAHKSTTTLTSPATSTLTTPVVHLKTTAGTRTRTTTRPATTTSATTTTNQATTESTTTTAPTTTVRETTTPEPSTTTPKTTTSATTTVSFPTTSSTLAAPLWETMFTRSRHPSSTEETTTAVSEAPRIKFQKPSTASAVKDGAPVRVHAQNAFVVEVDPKEESAPMGLIVGLSLGLVFIFIVLGVVGRQILDLWQRRHYSRMDFLVDGMYH